MSLTISGLIIVILSQFIPAEEAQTIATAIGLLFSYWGRIRVGDLTWYGARKE